MLLLLLRVAARGAASPSAGLAAATTVAEELEEELASEQGCQAHHYCTVQWPSPSVMTLLISTSCSALALTRPAGCAHVLLPRLLLRLLLRHVQLLR